MELKTYFAQDAAGNIISSAIVNVFLQGTTTLATGLTRADGTPLENPFAADGAGRIQFRAPDGYYDVQVSAGPGIIQTLTIQCVDYSGAKADADRAGAAAEQAQNDLNSITGINTNFEQNSREQWRRSLAESGLTLVSGSFEEGATATTALDAVWHIAGGQCYTWNGDFPKEVPADSTPSSSGGVGDGAWLSVDGVFLRRDLASSTGASMVGISQGGTVQDALLFVTPQMHTSTAGTGSDDSAALQWAFDSGLPVQLGGFTYKVNQLLTSTDKTISINGNDAKILCTAAGGIDIKLRPGEDYFYGAGFRVIADGVLTGDGLHVWSATSVAHGSPSVHLNNVYVDRSAVSNGFNRALLFENLFQSTLNNLHIRGSTFGAVFDSCVSIAMWNPDIVFSDTGFKTLATNRGCEGFRISGGFIYNTRISMDLFRVLDMQLQGTHLLGSEKILRIERSFQSSFSGAVWYCNTFDGTERDLISSHDTVQSVRFTDITVELVGTALGHHNVFVANSGFIQNTITACRFRNLTLNSGANENVVASVILEKTGGVTNLTDNGLRNKKVGIFSDGASSLDFSYSGTTQLRLSPNLVTVETPMTVRSVTEFYSVLDLHQSDAATETDYDARISISNATGVNAGGMMTVAAANIRPAADGGMDVGQAARRVNTFFGINGAINTSDERYKTEPQSIPDSWLDAAGEAAPWLWKWLDSVALKGELARTHCGPIAQHLVDAFVRHGVMEEGSTDSPFGGLCYDEWDDEYEPIIATRTVEHDDSEGNIVLWEEKYDTGEKRLVTKAGNRWSIRPDQCLWLRMAWLEREHQRKVYSIEQRLATLEAKP